MNRDFYTKLLKEIKDILKLEEGIVLKVIQPLYSILEAKNHWFKTYYQHYTEKLKIKVSLYNPYLLYTNNDRNFSVVGLQTNDTLFLTNEVFTI